MYEVWDVIWAEWLVSFAWSKLKLKLDRLEVEQRASLIVAAGGQLNSSVAFVAVYDAEWCTIWCVRWCNAMRLRCIHFDERNNSFVD